MMRLLKWMCVIGFVMVLGACQSGGDGGAAANSDPDHPIQWDRSPTSVIFRADTVGGDDAGTFLEGNVVPQCTIFGDNRVVWIAESATRANSVNWDRVSDEVIRNFVTTLQIEMRFYTYGAFADDQIPSSDNPVYEVLTLNVAGASHTTDSYADWPTLFYADIATLCQNLSQTPVVYEPEGAWISARAVDYSPSSPSLIWDGEASGLSFAELATSGEPVWVEGRNTRVLWNLLRTSAPDVQFAEGPQNYHVVVAVPGVTRNAPPAPGSN